MRLTVLMILVASTIVAGCSRSDPERRGLFGKKRDRAVASDTQTNPLIPRNQSFFDALRTKNQAYTGTPVDQIVSVKTERNPGGMLVTVTGLPVRDGAFDVRLVNDNHDEPVNGVLTYTLSAVQPEDTPQGPQYLREVTAGVFIADRQLAKTRTVQIVAARNRQDLRH